MSETRKVYIGRLIGRCVIFVICLFMYLFRRDFFTVLDGMNFFKEFSLLHLLWGVWVVDMTLQIIPIKNKVPLGSQKFFPVVSNAALQCCGCTDKLCTQYYQKLRS